MRVMPCAAALLALSLVPAATAAAQQVVRPRFVNLGASQGEGFVQIGVGTPARFVWLAAGRSVRSGGAEFEGFGAGGRLPRVGPVRLSAAGGLLHAGPRYRLMTVTSATLPAGPVRIRTGLNAHLDLHDGALVHRLSPMSATVRLGQWELGAVRVLSDGRMGPRATVPVFGGALTVEYVPARGTRTTELKVSYGG